MCGRLLPGPQHLGGLGIWLRDLAVVAVVAMKRERGVQRHVNKEIKKKRINRGEGGLFCFCLKGD